MELPDALIFVTKPSVAPPPKADWNAPAVMGNGGGGVFGGDAEVGIGAFSGGDVAGDGGGNIEAVGVLFAGVVG